MCSDILKINSMKHPDYTGIIPEQYTGKEVEAEASTVLEDVKKAIIFYDAAKNRLLNVNKWHQVAGFVSATFQVIDANGNKAERDAQKGDYIRVDIPGPGSKAGDGYDWSLIEELKEVSDDDMQSTGFRVRPAANPNGDPEHIAHFYDDTATSNFIITREGTTVTAIIIDRNVKPNDDAQSTTDKIRDTIVGMSALNMFSKAQWQNLAEGLVKREA